MLNQCFAFTFELGRKEKLPSRKTLATIYGAWPTLLTKWLWQFPADYAGSWEQKVNEHEGIVELNRNFGLVADGSVDKPQRAVEISATSV